jgi:uncharacterized circularly permuted ATP-grasp superfamily protein
LKRYLRRSVKLPNLFLMSLPRPMGVVREHWKKLAHAYDELGLEKMEQRSREISQELRDNGVTYNVYSDPDGINRPWKLDPVPMVLASRNGKTLNAAWRNAPNC